MILPALRIRSNKPTVQDVGNVVGAYLGSVSRKELALLASMSSEKFVLFVATVYAVVSILNDLEGFKQALCCSRTLCCSQASYWWSQASVSRPFAKSRLAPTRFVEILNQQILLLLSHLDILIVNADVLRRFFVPAIFSPLPEPKSASSRLTAIGFPQDKVPPKFICSISHAIMQFPVKSPEGHNFEEAYIFRSLQSDSRNPMNGEPLQASQLTPDTELSAEIEAFVAAAEKQAELQDDQQDDSVSVITQTP